MKTLIVVAHPNISGSTVNKRWVEELKKYPDKYTVNELTTAYPDKKINIEREQKLIEGHGNLILQFPIFWFSYPPILKQWLDDVLTHGFAYGRNGGDKLVNRKVALAVTAGIKQKDYQLDGRYHFTLEQLLAPMEATFRYYCHADYRSFYAFYGSEAVPGAEYSSTANEIEESTKFYLDFLTNL